MKKLHLGILGASTLTAKDTLVWLARWHFPYEDISLYDTKEHSGSVVFCADKYRAIQEIDEKNLKLIDLCFLCDDTLYEHYTKYVNDTCITINISKRFQNESLILPPFLLPDIKSKQKNFWIPNASICMMLHVLHIARKMGHIRSIDFTSLHSASELGRKANLELEEQVAAYVNCKELEANIFPLPSSAQSLPLLFQVLPQTSKILMSGETEEEMQLKTIISDFMDQDIAVFSTCVRIASLRGLAISMHLHYDEEIEVNKLIDCYASSPYCICFDDKEHDMYPILADVLHDYRIFIGRMRSPSANDFSAWAVCDDQSIRCGAAVQTALYVYHNFICKQ